MSDAPSTGRSWATPIAVLAGVCAVAAAVGTPLLRAERSALQRETAALRTARATAAQALDSLKGARDAAIATLALERARAGARAEPKLHLVIAVDSGTVALVRDGITLRTMPARFRGTAPARGSQSIAQIAETVVPAVAPTVDSLGNAVRGALPETKVERVTLSDGTVIEGGDMAAVLLGGTDGAPGPRAILLSRRDFAAIRPNLTKGMMAVLF